jgi:uncharacterized membrane protein YqiK
VLGIVLILLAIWSYVRGYDDAQGGDIEVRQNYKGYTTVSNQMYRLALVLAVAGAACFGASFPAGQDKSKNDKDSA